MKALILAAGFGSRLRPYTDTTPKPLFTIGGRPLLEKLIVALRKAGCDTIIINTHHLPSRIESFLKSECYPFPVLLRHEPVILGTGGAIKNIADLLNNQHNQPFFVINSDIVTDIDLRSVYSYHLKHNALATMVLKDDSRFNNVWVNASGYVDSFYADAPLQAAVSDAVNNKNPGARQSNPMTFTGIQVLNPEVTDYIPGNVFIASIDIYRRLIAKHQQIKAFLANDFYWDDIGTPQRYRDVNIRYMAPRAFKKAFPDDACNAITHKKLEGDGSNRCWYRLTMGHHNLIIADHGIRKNPMPLQTSEAEAFIAIGRHLSQKSLPVPEIYLYDTFAGLVFLEDLGDCHLQQVIRGTDQPEQIITWYQRVIDMMIQLALNGYQHFDLAWTWQTTHYDKTLILEKECRYFIDAFINKYLGSCIRFDDFANEFDALADGALRFAVTGFMHRDMQSRNIMVKNGKIWFIDFQGGRSGPLQYDLASLLIDPYVALPVAIQSHLSDYAIQTLSSLMPIDPEHFKECYYHCALARNLQILGAFGFLSKVRGKNKFEQYISPALHTLKNLIEASRGKKFPKLKKLISTL